MTAGAAAGAASIASSECSTVGGSDPISSQGSGMLSNPLVQTGLEMQLMWWSPFRRYCYRIVASRWFGSSILVLIVLNTALVSLGTDRKMERAGGWVMSLLDSIFLGIYCFELVAKLFVWRKAYFDHGWNIFDLVIVLLSFVEFLPQVVVSFSEVDPSVFRLLKVFRAMRALRALRVLRTISFLKSLQMIVNTLLKSIPAMSSIVMLLFLVLYTFALIGRVLYGEIYPEKFGSIWVAGFSLFQLITLDDWFEFHDAIKDQDSSIFFYLFIFIILETFIFVNLFIAVIVNNLHESQKNQNKRKARAQRQRRFGSFLRRAARRKPTQHGQDGDEKDNAAEDLVSPAAKAEIRAKKPFIREINHYYPDTHTPVRTKQLMAYYFMLMAALENNIDFYTRQQGILDDLVDAIVVKEEQ